MKSFAPAIPMILVLSVCVGFLVFKTFQLQAQINILVDMVQDSIPPKLEPISDNIRVPVAESCTVEPSIIETIVIPAKSATIVEELVKEVEAIKEEEDVAAVVAEAPAPATATTTTKASMKTKKVAK